MSDDVEHQLTEHRTHKLLLKNKMFALIKRQLEIIEFLEYSIDQDDARLNHLIYTSNILQISRVMDNIVRVLASLDQQIEELEKRSD